ncbi:Protein kinase domain [Macleaya cordata]|uniref:Protein kinase domain n=1 Tax=Macleaya cordata TaxID=56857 RepID=A0A200QZC6_MACCD|nr:Protein kinase domain [Macleaya cordata]
MEWVKGEIIGKGSFSSVYLATPRSNFYESPPLMAVKSSLVSQSSLLQKEKEILTQLRDCPQILNCFGDDLTVEKNGEKFYNLFLEFASGGNLAQLLKKSGGSISESHVRCYTKSILQGILNIHEKGYVHCDIKLQNILLCCSSDGSTEVKIADFGLAKKSGQMKNNSGEIDEEIFSLRGTPLYMAPESVSSKEFESPSDIWALGCVMSEMISGKPAWRCRADSDVSALLYRIGFRDEVPEIPDELCEEGKDFLRKCFVRDPTKRWTAEMLLNHPFIVDSPVSLPLNEKASPRSAFDFPEWSSQESSIFNSIESSSPSILHFDEEFNGSECSGSSSPSPSDRIRQLAWGNELNLSFTDSWITVRTESSVSGIEELKLQSSKSQ